MQDSQLLAYFSDLQDVFPVSSNMDSCSNKAGKKEFPFIPIDTPGLNEPTPLKDFVIILGMAVELEKLEFVNVFLIVFNGAIPGYDRSLIAMDRICQGMFGRVLNKNGDEKNEAYWTEELNEKHRRIDSKLIQAKESEY